MSWVRTTYLLRCCRTAVMVGSKASSYSSIRGWLFCFVFSLLKVPSSCKECLRNEFVQIFVMLPHWDRSGRSNLQSHPVTVSWHHANMSLYLSWHLSRTTSLAKWLRRPPWEQKIWGLNPVCDGILPGQVILLTSKLALKWLPCQAPGIIGSALGLVGRVSVYCDWMR